MAVCVRTLCDSIFVKRCVAFTVNKGHIPSSCVVGKDALRMLRRSDRRASAEFAGRRPTARHK